MCTSAVGTPKRLCRLVEMAGVERTHLLELLACRPVAGTRDLQVRGEALERRLGEEDAEPFAELALEDVRVAVAV